jgi:hypothetical protein
MRQLVEGLAWASGWRQEWSVPSSAAIAKARRRLGPRPLELLYGAVARPVGSEATRGAFYRGLRLMSIDGTTLDVADTPQNAEAFGRPGSSRRVGGGAFPQLRVVALSETGTHAICDVALGPCASAENALADELVGSLEQGSLCLADRGFYSFERFQTARASGAQLLWRVQSSVGLPREQTLEDGSYLTSIYALKDRKARRDGAPARVIEYARGSRPRPRGSALPADHHDPRSGRRASARARRALLRALGARGHHRRAQDPPARPARRAALQGPGRRLPGGLRLPVHPLRDPAADARRGAAGRHRPRPIVVHQRSTGRPSLSPHPAGIFPPGSSRTPMSRRSPRSSPSRCPSAASAPTPASSNAR